MSPTDNKDIRNKVLKGFRKAIKKLVAEKIFKNEKLIISRNGKIEEIKPGEI